MDSMINKMSRPSPEEYEPKKQEECEPKKPLWSSACVDSPSWKAGNECEPAEKEMLGTFICPEDSSVLHIHLNGSMLVVHKMSVAGPIDVAPKMLVHNTDTTSFLDLDGVKHVLSMDINVDVLHLITLSSPVSFCKYYRLRRGTVLTTGEGLFSIQDNPPPFPSSLCSFFKS
eukprot:TRINITY_DN3663_c0_g1_i8.p1 TRINITY_DN3663_c0_g1~~TRINITY_DN3663_c0_g1_i8.p1  ORF type:complete len:172 (+),score=16.83 TRINITY_DN3663_c0_g1_i8:518-1033(+)